MFEDSEPNPPERTFDPAQRARARTNELRMHAELAAVFEGCRKFDASLRAGLDATLARQIQQTVGKLEKSKPMDNTLIPPESAPDAAALLDYPASNGFSTNDYHIHRRPGEVMIVRWLQGDEVASFYERMQAHFDTAMAGAREDERQMHEWKQDPVTLQYLDALDAVTLNMAELYRRDPIKQHRVFVLSTLTADEININFLAEHLMGQTAADLVGDAFAPTEAPTNQELAWFFKLFSLRGMHGSQERMCFFTYLQKSDDPFDFE